MLDSSTTTGMVVITTTGPDGQVRNRFTVRNLVTDSGDRYHAARIAAGVPPASPSDTVAVNGMKLGTGIQPVAKTGPGAALGNYLPGAFAPFDDGFPRIDPIDTGGWTVTYECTFPIGVATDPGLTEAVIVSDALADAPSSDASTIARIVFAPYPKKADEALTVSWAHKQSGM